MQYVERNRERDRIRARLNANFRVNDTITGVLGISTGSTDPRSGNQTLTDQNARKDFDLDLAYVTWAPNAQWKLTAGKQRYPWQRTGALLLRQRRESGRNRGQLHHGQLLRQHLLRLARRARAVVRQRDDRHQHRLDHVRRAGGISNPVLRRDEADGGRHLLQLRWRAGLQPVLRWQLLRQHDDDQRRSLQPDSAGRASAYGLPAVRLRHHRRLCRSDHVVRRPAAALLHRLRAEHRSRSESGGAARSWIRHSARASRMALPRPSREPGNSA